MSMLSRKLLMAAAGAQGGALDVADVFSTDLFTPVSARTRIINNLDMLGEGGLVWLKRRTSASNHWWTDTQTGAGKYLSSSAGWSQSSDPQAPAFFSDGFDVGQGLAPIGGNEVAWTFRRAPKFFDIVTYTGDGNTYQQIPHNLGCQIGFMVIKRIDQASDWPAFVRISDTLISGPVNLNGTGVPYFQNANFSFGDSWISSGAATYFMASHQSGMDSQNGNSTNAAGASYVAYLFAHDPSPEGIIQCGSFSTDGSGVATIDLGWEPQWVLIKRVDGVGSWMLFDQTRGWASGTDYQLNAESSASEVGGYDRGGEPTNTGFQITSGFGNSAGPYSCIAIRAEGV